MIFKNVFEIGGCEISSLVCVKYKQIIEIDTFDFSLFLFHHISSLVIFVFKISSFIASQLNQ